MDMISRKTVVPVLLAAAAALAAGPVASAAPPSAPAGDATPVRAGEPHSQREAGVPIPGATYDVRTAASGRRFSVFVHRPTQAPPQAGYPVAYFLDAEASLGMTIDSARLLVEAGRMDPVVLVGIGVPREEDIGA